MNQEPIIRNCHFNVFYDTIYDEYLLREMIPITQGFAVCMSLAQYCETYGALTYDGLYVPQPMVFGRFYFFERWHHHHVLYPGVPLVNVSRHIIPEICNYLKVEIKLVGHTHTGVPYELNAFVNIHEPPHPGFLPPWFC